MRQVLVIMQTAFVEVRHTAVCPICRNTDNPPRYGTMEERDEWLRNHEHDSAHPNTEVRITTP